MEVLEAIGQWFATFGKSILCNQFFLMFAILVVGYAIGRITVCGLNLGTAGVLLVGLVAGHFGEKLTESGAIEGFTMNFSVVKNLGLICFVVAVGLIAGPKFFRNFKVNAKSYVLLGVIIILMGALTTIGVVTIFKVPSNIASGLMSGALTSTPGLGAGLDAVTGAEAQAGVTAGYGIAYPFGILGVVLFVQLLPKLLKIDMDKERSKFSAAAGVELSVDEKESKRIKIDSMGFFPLSLAVVLGIVLALIKIPLPGGSHFALGTSGGPLIVGLLVGHFGHIGKISLKIDKRVLECMREFGLALFLLGSGVEGGKSFVKVLSEQGAMLFVYGALITLIPMLVGYIFATKVLKLGIINALGSICGGMTSTPALGSLIKVAKTDEVASAYAATYPFALVCVVLACQLIPTFL